MKGIAHFVTGVAIATFFPGVVERAAEGGLLPLVGGIAAILPDTLDFRFVRYAERYDLVIDPGPNPKPDQIARQLVDAMRDAVENQRPCHVMLHTIQLGPDSWRQYVVRFRPPHGEVSVQVGPVVDTGQKPIPGSEFDGPSRATVRSGLVLRDDACDEVKVDIFSGPSLLFAPRGDRLAIRFLPWHRRWSHSLTAAATLGMVTAGLAAVLGGGLRSDPVTLRLFGLVAGLGATAHLLQDQLGHMGGNLLFPITRRRTPGVGLFHSGDTLPNAATVWTALILTVFNLDRFSGRPGRPAFWLLAGSVVLPVVAALGVRWAAAKKVWSEASDPPGCDTPASEPEHRQAP